MDRNFLTFGLVLAIVLVGFQPAKMPILCTAVQNAEKMLLSSSPERRTTAQAHIISFLPAEFIFIPNLHIMQIELLGVQKSY